MVAASEWNAELNPVIGALQRGHYLLYCQQIQALSEPAGEQLFNEILVRLFEEERRLLPPGMFFPMLQEQGLMSLLDCWVVNQVLKLQDAAKRARPGWVAPINSLNLSEDSVLDPEFATFVANQVEKWKPPQGILSFEIMSTVMIDEPDGLNALMTSLLPLGCSFALGGCTGSSEELAAIGRLPLRFVKIDGSLIRKLLVSPNSLSRVATINLNSHERGIKTVAEFVEDNETRAALLKLGVDYVQGFGIAQPVPFLAEF